MDATPFRSRFLRPSGEFQKNSSADENNEESSSSSYNNSNNKRPSVSDLRKRYDQNRNHVETRTSPLTTKPPIMMANRSGESPVAPARRATIESNSDSEESGSRTPVNKRHPEVVKNSSTSGRKDFNLRSSSPSTLSSTSSSSDDGETQVGGNLI